MIDLEINLSALVVCVIALALFVLFFVWVGSNIGVLIEILFDVVVNGSVVMPKETI